MSQRAEVRRWECLLKRIQPSSLALVTVCFVHSLYSLILSAVWNQVNHGGVLGKPLRGSPGSGHTLLRAPFPTVSASAAPLTGQQSEFGKKRDTKATAPGL